MEQWLFLVRKLAGRVEPWWGKFMSSGGRLILSNSCLASLPQFAMGLFLLQDGIHAKFDSHRARFYWEGTGPKRRYHLVNWPAVCRPKECGGLGLLNSKKMNLALMIKWIWKLYQADNPIWAQIIRGKYNSANNIFEGTGQGGSQFWRSLHKIKHLFKLGAKFEIRDGRRTQFWMDKWTGHGALKDRFPELFNIANAQMSAVAQVCGPRGTLSFRRSLDPQNLEAWQQLRAIIEQTSLSQGQDRVSWSLEPSG
jgi:hypothetical protein